MGCKGHAPTATKKNPRRSKWLGNGRVFGVQVSFSDGVDVAAAYTLSPEQPLSQRTLRRCCLLTRSAHLAGVTLSSECLQSSSMYLSVSKRTKVKFWTHEADDVSNQSTGDTLPPLYSQFWKATAVTNATSHWHAIVSGHKHSAMYRFVQIITR